MYYCLAKCTATPLSSIDEIRKALAQAMENPSSHLMNFFVEYHKTDDNPEPSLVEWHDAVLKDSEWGSNFESSLFGAIYGVDVRIVTNSLSGLEESDTRTLLEMYRIDSIKMIPKDAPKFYLYLHQHRYPQVPTQEPNHFAILDPVDYEPPEGSVVYNRTENIAESQLAPPIESLKIGDVNTDLSIQQRRTRHGQPSIGHPVDPDYVRQRCSSLAAEGCANGRMQVTRSRARRATTFTMAVRHSIGNDMFGTPRFQGSESSPVFADGDEVLSLERNAQSSERPTMAQGERSRQESNVGPSDREQRIKPRPYTASGAGPVIEESRQCLPHLGIIAIDESAQDHSSQRHRTAKEGRIMQPHERTRPDAKLDAIDLEQSNSRSAERDKGPKRHVGVESSSDLRSKSSVSGKTARSQQHDSSQFRVTSESKTHFASNPTTSASASRQGKQKRETNSRDADGDEKAEFMRGQRRPPKAAVTRQDGAATPKAFQASREVGTLSSNDTHPFSVKDDGTGRSETSSSSSKNHGISSRKTMSGSQNGVGGSVAVDALVRPNVQKIREDKTAKGQTRTASMLDDAGREGGKGAKLGVNAPITFDEARASIPHRGSTMDGGLDLVNHIRYPAASKMRRRDDCFVDTKIQMSGLVAMETRERAATAKLRMGDDSIVDSRVLKPGLAATETKVRNEYITTVVRQSTVSSSMNAPRRSSMPEGPQMPGPRLGPRPEQTRVFVPGRKSDVNSRMSESRQNAHPQFGRGETSGGAARRHSTTSDMNLSSKSTQRPGADPRMSESRQTAQSQIAGGDSPAVAMRRHSTAFDVNSSSKPPRRSSMIGSRVAERMQPIQMASSRVKNQPECRVLATPLASSQGPPPQTSIPSQQNPNRRMRNADNHGQARMPSTTPSVVHDGHEQVRAMDRTRKAESIGSHRSTESHGSALSNSVNRNVREIDKPLRPRHHRTDPQSEDKRASTTAWAAQIEGKTRGRVS